MGLEICFLLIYNSPMFGLMKLNKCRADGEEKNQYRLAYCGVCKTIGKQFGQKMRVSLNYDIAFFAEILAQISGEIENKEQWSGALYRSNCFRLPEKTDRVPLSFSIAAAVNVLLAELTLRDKIEDSGAGSARHAGGVPLSERLPIFLNFK